jgi:hypothetical protein
VSLLFWRRGSSGSWCHTGDRGKPRQDPGNRSNETPCSTQGRLEVNGVACNPQPLHLEAGKESSPLLQVDEGVRSIHMDRGGRASLPRNEAVSHLSHVLVAPEPGEMLFLYIAATTEVINMVLVAERSEQLMQGAPEVPPVEGGGPTITNVTTDPASGGSAGSRPGKKPEDLGSGESPAQGEEPSPAAKVKTIQKPVYYISEVLNEAKAKYSETHKLLYAILIASRKLRHYFQAHKIVVVTSYPLRAILCNSNATGNIAKWAAELC